MNDWDGKERRRDSRDHDLLTLIHADLSNFMRRFDEHADEDNEHFKRIYPKISSLEKFMWKSIGISIGLGMISTIILVIEFLKNKQ